MLLHETEDEQNITGLYLKAFDYKQTIRYFIVFDHNEYSRDIYSVRWLCPTAIDHIIIYSHS